MRRLSIRLVMSVVLVFAVTAISFFFEALIPGNAAGSILGPEATPSEVHRLSVQLGLDQPAYERYFHWLGGLFRGDLGTSYATGQPVSSLLPQQLPVTLAIVVGSTLVAVLLGVGLGVLSALRPGRLGRFVDALSALGMALPNFWLALVLVELFAVLTPVFPATGYVSPGTSPGLWLRSLVLPVLALGLHTITLIAQQTSEQMSETLQQGFVQTLRANGASHRSIVFRHALRNAAIPIVTVVGIAFVGLLGGTVFIERVFSLPGLGSGLTTATNTHDLPVVQGISLYFILIVIAVNFLTDLTYTWLNPRARRAW